MSPEPGSSDRADWLLEPPEAGTYNLHIQLGDQVELSPRLARPSRRCSRS